MPITITKTHNGPLLSIIYRGNYYKLLCQGYSRKEAKSAFRAYVREEDAKIIRDTKR